MHFFGLILLVFYFKTVHPRSFGTCAVFLPKTAEHDVIKKLFSKKKSTDFMEDFKLISDAKIWRRYLLSLLSHQQNTRGVGNIYPPPPSAGHAVRSAHAWGLSANFALMGVRVGDIITPSSSRTKRQGKRHKRCARLLIMSTFERIWSLFC